MAFLDAAKTGEEIAGATEIPGKVYVGIKVAQSLLDRSGRLGRSKDAIQVEGASQVGPETITQIVEALGARKEAETGYDTEGQTKRAAKIDFGKEKLAVHAFAGDVKMARTNADGRGKYKLIFKYQDEPPATDLRLLTVSNQTASVVAWQRSSGRSDDTRTK